jgi:type III secretion protein D
MSKTSELELRIHSGSNAGAREPLDAQSYVLGAGDTCDFVLGDADLLPQQLHLEFDPTGWRMRRWGPSEDKPGDAEILELGLLYAVGPLVISINNPRAPWPGTSEIGALLSKQADERDLADAITDHAEDEVATETPVAPTEESAHAKGQRPPRQANRTIIAVLLAVIVGPLLWVLLPHKRDMDSAVTKSAAPTVQAGPTSILLAQAAINAIILNQGLADRVNVQHDQQGKLVVRAALLSEDEYEKLARALSAINPRPALAVTTEQDLKIAVGDAVARSSVELETPISIRHLGGAQFRLEGTLRSDAERSAFLTRLKNGLPAMAVLELGLLIPEDLAKKMLNELREANFADTAGGWIDGRLQMVTRLVQSDVPEWERILVSVARKYKVPFSVKVTVLPKNNARAGTLTSLPFHLQSVVGGETPYVVLEGGIKLLLDGRSQGWRLASIDPTSVVFEGANAKRVVLER